MLYSTLAFHCFFVCICNLPPFIEKIQKVRENRLNPRLSACQVVKVHKLIALVCFVIDPTSAAPQL